MFSPEEHVMLHTAPPQLLAGARGRQPERDVRLERGELAGAQRERVGALVVANLCDLRPGEAVH